MAWKPKPQPPYEVKDEDLRETVHWRKGSLLDTPLVACGAESGPFTANQAKVTCAACKAAD